MTVQDFVKVGLLFELLVFGVTSTAGFALFSAVLRDACDGGAAPAAYER